MNALENLRHEHNLLHLLLESFDRHLKEAGRSGRLTVDTSKDILDVVRSFAAGAHMVKEERHLVPKLFELGVPRNYGPLLLLGEEHGQIYDNLSHLFDAFEELYEGNASVLPLYMDLATTMIRFNRLHMMKEENSIFTLAETVCGENDWRELGEAFEHADRVFGLERALAFEKKIHAIAAEFNLTLRNGEIVPLSKLNMERSGAFVLKIYQPQ